MRQIRTLDDLHALCDAPVPSALRKGADRLTPLDRRWTMGSRYLHPVLFRV